MSDISTPTLQKNTKLSIFFKISSWFFGITAILMGFSLFSSSFIGALLTVIAGVLVLPPLTEKYVIPVIGKAIVWAAPLAFMIIFGVAQSVTPKTPLMQDQLLISNLTSLEVAQNFDKNKLQTQQAKIELDQKIVNFKKDVETKKISDQKKIEDETKKSQDNIQNKLQAEKQKLELKAKEDQELNKKTEAKNLADVKSKLELEEKQKKIDEEKNKPRLTLETFNKIKTGQSLQDVESTVGKGELTSENEIAGYKSQSFTLKGETFASNAILIFQDDKLISKSQFGLK
jgi:hypothetical protein